MSKGKDLELRFSKFLHERTLPLLISQDFLRSRQCGQVDVSCLKKLSWGWEVNLYELKSSFRITLEQRLRLSRSIKLISAIFDAPAKIHYVIGDSFSSPWPL